MCTGVCSGNFLDNNGRKRRVIFRRRNIVGPRRRSACGDFFYLRRFSGHAYFPRSPSNTSAKLGWLWWLIQTRAASSIKGIGWPCKVPIMICLTTP